MSNQIQYPSTYLSPPKDRSEYCYLVEVDSFIDGKWRSVLSYVTLDSLYREEHREDAEKFFHAFTPKDDFVEILEDGIYRVVMRHGVKRFFENESAFEVEETTELPGAKRFIVKTEKVFSWINP